MENFKVGLIFLSVILNFYLISELKKQSSAHLLSLETLGTRIQTMVAAPPATEKAISNSALMDMVNTAVHDEILRARPNTSMAGATDSQRIDQLQARLEAMQNGLSEKAAGGGGSKDKKMREEAQKLKAEILAACSKK